ncbi:MAG: nicotinate-nucleotide--dimethylbenzimidazole phosphoribosyltransferase [Myxococcales bacterium FL481]|nr:MAG: nicotinate-nucleotide--dimethylbenzimidazole phosphoribosyltransferase [Myxococcales bacterium FL481]
MARVRRTIASVAPVDRTWGNEVAALLDAKTKPRGSLGRLEWVACRVAAIRRTSAPQVGRKAVLVMCGDHGVAAEGVSAYPQAVTAQMVANFASGGAAINVLARAAGAEVVVVDVGVAVPVADRSASVQACRVRPGTRSITQGAAMTAEETARALCVGVAQAEALIERGVELLALGEMGIGNTTSASAITSAFLGVDPAGVTGHGTGLDEAGWRRKVDAIRHALLVNRPRQDDAFDVLSKLGGFELAGLCGAALAAAARGVPVLLDGFISSVAAWCAVRMCETVGGYLLASHRSVETGHTRVLRELGLEPLLDLQLRLGEGTGAALAMPLVDAALAILRDMATFTDAGVSDSGA